MNDPLILLSFVAVSVASTAWFVVYQCADAELHGNRRWWRKALFRAKQRAEYNEFCQDAERAPLPRKEPVPIQRRGGR